LPVVPEAHGSQGVEVESTKDETVSDEIVSFRYVGGQVARLENHEHLTDAERDGIGSVAGALRTWLNQWDQWRKQGRAA
jgi:hypothetical protein